MIALKRVIPAMREVPNAVVAAIASRDAARARAAADEAGIEQSYGSYEAMLADPAIEVVYVALPNHLHVEWCVKAMDAGKHVLCDVHHLDRRVGQHRLVGAVGLFDAGFVRGRTRARRIARRDPGDDCIRHLAHRRDHALERDHRDAENAPPHLVHGSPRSKKMM